MGIIIRQSVKATIATYLGFVVGYVNTLWLLPYFFTESEIGLIRLIMDTALILTYFAQLGIPNMAVKFYPRYTEDKVKYYGFLFFLLLMPTIGFVVFATIYYFSRDILIWLYEERAAEFLNYMYYVVPLLLLLVLVQLFESYAKIKLRIVVPTIVRQLIVRVLQGGAILLWAFYGMEFSAYVNMYIGAYGVALLILWIYVKQLGDFKLTPDKSFFNKETFRPLMTYGGFIVIGSMGSIIAAKIDVIMLSSLKGLDYTGVYSIAFFIATVIEIPKRSLGQISAPVLSTALEQDNLAEVDSIYKKSSTNLGIAGMFVFLLVWVNIESLFHFMPRTEVYIAGKYVVLFIGMSKIVQMTFGVNDQIILNSKYYKFNFLAILFLVGMTVATNWYFIPIYGVSGAAVATALSMLAFNVLKMIFIWIVLKTQPFTVAIIKLIAATGLALGANYLLPALDMVIIDLAVRLILVGLVFGVAILLMRTSDDVNSLVRKYLPFI